MKFIVTNETFQTELALLSSVASGKSSSIPVLQNILIESIDDSSLKLTSSDLDVTLYCQAEARVTEPGKVLLPLAKLLAITKRCQKPPISISDQSTTAVPTSPSNAPRSNYSARTQDNILNCRKPKPVRSLFLQTPSAQ